MQNTASKISHWTITLGALVFIAVLFISAYWEADIRWLHFFQAWMYIATIALAWKKSRWGYFIGIGAAALWDYATLFVNTFLKNGLDQASILIKTGHLPHPDQLISVPAWLGNAAVILGCLFAYLCVVDKKWTDLSRLVAAAVGTTAYFALIVALFQPRYLPMFPALLHPHLHL